MHVQDMVEHVRSVFVRMTRYPDEVVAPDADLEQDLGIDSVKRGEIIAALRTEFALPTTLKATPDDLRSVARVAGFLSRHVTARAAGDTPPKPAVAEAKQGSHVPLSTAHGAPGAALEPATLQPDDAPRANGVMHHGQTVGTDRRPVDPAPAHDAAPGSWSETVLGVLADVTHHPRSLLVPEARLEDDLGIDRRRWEALVTALRQRGVEATDALGGLDQVNTVGALLRSMVPAATTAIDAPRRRTLEAPRTAPTAASELAGKTILVTGASRGLGRVIATQLARAGARVVVNSFHARADGEAVTNDIRAAGGEAIHVWGSLANPGHVDAMFEAIEREVGELHHFVSNASNGRFGPLERTTAEHWELAFRTNVIGYHQAAMHAARLMARQGGGRIVALSSNGASRYLEHFGAMGAVKAAVESLTRSLAVELAPRKVQVNCVSAGPIYGFVTNHYPDHERLLPYWESRTPGGRLCYEEDVAAAVIFLLSGGARMINGATLTVDGGGSLAF